MMVPLLLLHVSHGETIPINTFIIVFLGLTACVFKLNRQGTPKSIRIDIKIRLYTTFAVGYNSYSL